MNQYFSQEGNDRFGNRSIVLKTVTMVSLFLTPIILISTGIVDSVWLMFVFYMLSGLGMIGIGMGTMHDAIHGSYSKKKGVNILLGHTLNLIGSSPKVWQIQHNVLHHTYTNIGEADEDIQAPFFLRFSPYAKKYWVHRFQHFYFWLFYGLITLSWVTFKDFITLPRYSKMGLLAKNEKLSTELLKVIMWKILYYSYALVLPLIFAPFSWYIVVIGFCLMHFVGGLGISLIVQTAHVMPDSEFPEPNTEGIIKDNWFVHQIRTTTNYAQNSKIFSWLIGGLNYQIEHHLFPNICHVHYKKLSPIVRRTAEEFNIEYSCNRTFISALAQHIAMLKRLGSAK